MPQSERVDAALQDPTNQIEGRAGARLGLRVLGLLGLLLRFGAEERRLRQRRVYCDANGAQHALDAIGRVELVADMRL